MNSTRIRYRENGDGVLVSVQTFAHATNGTRFKVYINQNVLGYKILEDLSEVVVAEGKATSLHKVKIKAKAKLVDLGITFDGETRTASQSPEAVIETNLPA